MQGACRVVDLMKGRHPKLLFPGHFPPPPPPFHTYLTSLLILSSLLCSPTCSPPAFVQNIGCCFSFCLKCPMLAPYVASASSISLCRLYLSGRSVCASGEAVSLLKQNPFVLPWQSLSLSVWVNDCSQYLCSFHWSASQ